MEKQHWLAQKFEAMIGEGKKFKTRNEMAMFLGLGETTRTKLLISAIASIALFVYGVLECHSLLCLLL